MKKIIVFTFLLISIVTYGQKDARIKDSIALFAPTPKGNPDGEPLKQTIGKDGGRIISSDKKTELIIPAGALSSETIISVQAVTNLAAGGFGKTYRFEPSGLHFLQPAQLVFHYTEEDAKEGSPEIMSIASQDEKGNWYRIGKPILDTTAKTISGTTLHFSEFVKRFDLILHPVKQKIKVGSEMVIELYVAPANFPMEEWVFDVREQARAKFFDYQDQSPRIWSVNEVIDGDGINGKIIKGPEASDYSVIYQAPQKVPDWDPVYIQVQIKGVEEDGKLITVYRRCQVRVYDNLFKVSMVASITTGDKRSWGGKTTYSDEGSITVNLDNKVPYLIDLDNNFETMTDNCKKIILNSGNNTGIIHITGLQQIIVHPPSSPGGDRVIEVFFVQRPAEFTKVRYSCPPPPGYLPGNANGDNDAVMPVPALPIYLKFIANDEEQILMEMGKPGGELYYKFSVKKVKE